MLRLFVAVTLPDDTLAACGRETRRIEAALGRLAASLRFPHGEGLHFTLKFLGPTPDEAVPAIEAGLAKAASEVQAFTLVLKGLQAFPSPRKPRVVYLGVPEGGAPMVSLAAAVERHIAPLGFPTEKRPFTPHVTLARVKDFKAAPRIGERLAGLPVEEVDRVTIVDVALMRSELHPGGSRYTVLARFPLRR